ncbi:MAG: hypothetical protein KKD63_13290 [Proteobacteria bacterium]|nr:hypothetical protein [Desulfobulbaceae bacterium]MBU4153842.1 hypothetical protein [Pseudomonadota bacterium]MDP2105077.1 hypothetical protein [Desulfobulbaceae bacterium]
MEKREKIIVIMVVVAALYGVIDFTLTSKKKKLESLSLNTSSPVIAMSSAELEALISADNIKIAALTVSINDPWPKQIFTTELIDFDGEKKVDETREALMNELRAKVNDLYYSGFVSMGDDRIAIINNMDYRIGEQIEGFTITKITIDAVQISASDANFDIPATTELQPPVPGQTPPQPE